MQKEHLDTLMQDSAGDAVNTARDELQLDLNFSEDTLDCVDSAIIGLQQKYPQQTLEDKAVFTLCNIFGAYLGELFRKHHGGEWIYDDSDANAPVIFLKKNDRTFAFAGICYEKLVKNPKVSVASYYRQASSQK